MCIVTFAFMIRSPACTDSDTVSFPMSSSWSRQWLLENARGYASEYVDVTEEAEAVVELLLLLL